MSSPGPAPSGRSPFRGLFLKYAAIFVAVVGGAVLVSGVVQGYFAYQSKRDAIGDL